MKSRRIAWIVILLLADILLLTLYLCGHVYMQGIQETRYTQTLARAQVSDEAPAEEQMAEEKKIALTFDDGPNEKYTLPLLQGLKERNVKVTFFLLGQEVAENPEIAKEIAKDGHTIGNHSFYHKDLCEMRNEEAILQVSRTNEVIYEVTGEYPQFIRPPFGRAPKNLIYEPPMMEVLWTIDSRDWELSDVGTIMQNVLPNAEENAIILMHDSSQSSVQAALAIVDSLQKEGYTFVTLDEILFD